MANKRREEVPIVAATVEARNLLQAALTQLKNATLARTEDEPRMFFPKGIELISIRVEVSPVIVDLKVAGESGVSGLLLSMEGEESMSEAIDGQAAHE